MTDRTSLGDRMKFYEKRYADHIMLPRLPVMARIDGRSFSSFTRGLKKPYDERMSQLMIDTTKFLVHETNARCGYTQSDEITLVWLGDDECSQLMFDGKLLKMVSVIGSLATAYFNKQLAERLPEKAHLMPVFDNRVWDLPTWDEAVNCFIWREQDATRNSIQGAARSVYSHSECENKNGSQLQEMLFQKGINWNDYPNFFKRGTYVRKKIVTRPLTAEELATLPPKHKGRQNPALEIERTIMVEEKDWPPLQKIANRNEVILFGGEPELRSFNQLFEEVAEDLGPDSGNKTA